MLRGILIGFAVVAVAVFAGCVLIVTHCTDLGCH